MAASMKGQTPELKLYLRSNKLPDIYEALLTGLAVMCPGDPHQFILDKLGILVENGLGDLNWDMFVDPEMKPVNKIITESSLDFIFNMDDESIIPDEEAVEQIHNDPDEDYSDIPENIQKGQGFYGGRFQGLAASKKVWVSTTLVPARGETLGVHDLQRTHINT